MIRAKFLGVGMYVPPKVVTNDDLSTLMDTSDEWIRQRTGIEQRHWVEGKTTNADLGFEASKMALSKAGIEAKEIDLIVYATLSSDHDFPGTGVFLQKKLGIGGCATIDIRQQCTGFVYGLSIADQFIRSGMYKKVLVVGSEVHSRGLDRSPRGREVSVLFGDGAGAAILGAVDVKDGSKDSYLCSTHLHSDGNFAEELWVAGPGMGFGGETRFPTADVSDEVYYPKMNGKTVFLHACKRMPEAVMEALNASEKKIEDIDLFIFHQANLRINDMVAKQFSIPEHKVFNTIQKYANTTAATIPIGLAEAERAGKLKPGMLVAIAAFGSGFTWGSALVRW